MPQDIKYIKRSSALICKEAEDYIHKDVEEGFISLRVSQIDKFLVDGRRQIRLWKRDLPDLQAKCSKLERERKLCLAKQTSLKNEGDELKLKHSEEELSFIEHQLNDARSSDEELRVVIEELTTKLEALEDKVQGLRQKMLQNQSQPKTGSLKVSDIVEGYKENRL